jgi:uncharacterized protein (TIGR03790 family)
MSHLHKTFWPLFTVILFSFFNEFAQAAPKEGELKNHLLVVYNTAVDESEPLARYYAEKRGIPRSHVLGIRAPSQEEITREEYNSTIRDPIDAYLVNQKWIDRQPGRSPYGAQQIPVMAARQNDIWAIVLIYGVPLKIAHDPKLTDAPATNAALNTNASSVDSELTLLPYQGMPITSYVPNSYNLVSSERSFDGLDAKHMVMVTRLDGPAPADVRRLIDDALFAEQSRLVGNVYIDARGIKDKSQGYYQGDRWLQQSATYLKKAGLPVTIDDTPELFPNALPWTNIAMYAGWYGSDASGPFMRSSKSFSRGAIAYHIHSFSAATLKNPTANWCAPFIAKGVAATIGAVYEPYLDFMPQWDIVTQRLLAGYTWAEACYASQRALSWMTVFVGDPLYTPFKITLEEAISSAPSKPGERRDFLMIQQARIALDRGEVLQAKELAEKAIRHQDSSFAGWEGYAEIMSDPRLDPPNATVAQAYERAFNLSLTTEDQVRLALKGAQAYESRFRPQDAKRLLSLMLTRYPNEAVSYGVEAMQQRLLATYPSIQEKKSAAVGPLPNGGIKPPNLQSPSISPSTN